MKREKQKQRKKYTLRFIACGLVLLIICSVGGFQIVRIMGRARLLAVTETAQLDMREAFGEEIPEEERGRKWQEGWIKYNGKIYAYNEDILTFLVMGIDREGDVKEASGSVNGGQADALFLAVMNPHDKTIKVIGINRNTMTDIDVYDEEGACVRTVRAQIAVQHGFGKGTEDSCERQVEAVRRLFYSLPVHGYAAINMSAIPAINDAVGGVDVTVLEDLTGKDSSLVKDEKVHLEGESAFWYVKYRDIRIPGSADMRLARQKQYLNAFIKEAKQAVKKDISVAFDLYSGISRQMVTDITLDEIAYLAPALADCRFDSGSLYLLEGETVMGEKFEEFYADEDALYRMILEIFYEEIGDE